MEHFFHCLKAVTFDQSLSISASRKSADKQLAERIRDPGLRAWLLMNMRQHPETRWFLIIKWVKSYHWWMNIHREIGWRINLDAIPQAFLKTISVFPDSDGAQYEVQSNNNLKLAAALRSCYRVLRSSLEGLTAITFLWQITTWSKSSSPRLSSNILQAPAIGYTVKSQSSFLNVF